MAATEGVTGNEVMTNTATKYDNPCILFIAIEIHLSTVLTDAHNPIQEAAQCTPSP